MQKTINVPLKANIMTDISGFSYMDDIEGISCHGRSDHDAVKTLKARAIAAVAEALECSRQYRRHIIGTMNHTVFVVSFRHGSWQYDIAGPDRSHSSSCMFAPKDSFESVVEYARKHAADYDGILWEHSL